MSLKLKPLEFFITEINYYHQLGNNYIFFATDMNKMEIQNKLLSALNKSFEN